MSVITRILDNKYQKEGLFFDRALQTWKEAQLSVDDIRDVVYFDVNHKLSRAEALEVYKLSRTIHHADFYDEQIKRHDALLIQKLAEAETIKVTPNIKQYFERQANNTYRMKFAEVDISWQIVEKVGDNGQKAYFLARLDTLASDTDGDSKERIAKRAIFEGLPEIGDRDMLPASDIGELPPKK